MTLRAVIGLSLVSSPSYGVIFLGGNLANDANWQGGSRPGAGEIGEIDVDGTLVIGNTLGQWITGDPVLVIGGGATITAGDGVGIGVNNSGDWGHTNAASSTFNNATLNADDDIFANSSVITFNVGSSGNAGDDFEANGLSTININGGTHTAGDFFGAQGNNTTSFGTLNLTGGMITAGQFRVADFGVWNLGGSTILTGGGTVDNLTGAVNISNAWTGSWTISTLAGTDWETEVTGGDYTLNGVTVDAALFASDFLVSPDGTTLSLNTIPEPSSALLSVLGLLGLLRRSRR